MRERGTLQTALVALLIAGCQSCQRDGEPVAPASNGGARMGDGGRGGDVERQCDEFFPELLYDTDNLQGANAVHIAGDTLFWALAKPGHPVFAASADGHGEPKQRWALPTPRTPSSACSRASASTSAGTMLRT